MDLSNSLFSDDPFQSVPERTGNIEKVYIKEKLQSLGFDLSEFSLGEFDYIGEFTAKKQRSPDSELFKTVGAFFRPNYERGLLIESLIKKYDVKSYLEIGFGRGYSCFCAARAMENLGRGSIVTVDTALDEEVLQRLGSVFPHNWFDRVTFYKDTSDAFFKQNSQRFDMIYIDGDHRYTQVKKDWENSEKIFEKVVLFDDYHLPGKVQKDMEVSSLVDAIDDYDKELVIQDRRIFLDDRGWEDSKIDYGQVIITKRG